MPSFAKELGEASSLERLHTTRLGEAARRVLSAVEGQPGGVTPQALSIRTVLPLNTVLGSILELESAGLILVDRQDGYEHLQVMFRPNR